MSKHLGAPALLEIAISEVDDHRPPLSYSDRDKLVQAVACFLNGTISFDECKSLFSRLMGTTAVIDRLKDVIDVCNDDKEPSSPSDDIDIESSPVHKKSKPWSQSEDVRLLAGIYKFGLENWSNVASFVGNGRTRSQASQRWTRGLNPRLSKEAWSSEEDQKLFSLVQQFGDRCWTQIASKMGNRSDVQCRYHYHQVLKIGSYGSQGVYKPNNSPFNFNYNFNIQALNKKSPGIINNKPRSQLPLQLPRFSLLDQKPSTGENPNNLARKSDRVTIEQSTRTLLEQKIASELKSANEARMATNITKPNPRMMVYNMPQSQPAPKLVFAGINEIQHDANTNLGDEFSLDSFLSQFRQ